MKKLLIFLTIVIVIIIGFEGFSYVKYKDNTGEWAFPKWYNPFQVIENELCIRGLLIKPSPFNGSCNPYAN